MLLLASMAACSGGGRGSKAAGPDDPTEISVIYSRNGTPSIEVSWTGDPGNGSYTVAVDKKLPELPEDSMKSEEYNPALKKEKAESPYKFEDVSSLEYGVYYICVIPVKSDGSFDSYIAAKDKVQIGEDGVTVVPDSGATTTPAVDNPVTNPVTDPVTNPVVDPVDPTLTDVINNPTGDADGDGVPNWVEIAKGTDPLNGNDKPAPGTWEDLSQNTDSDGDGVVDWIEIAFGSDPNNGNSVPDPTQLINNPTGDADGDGVPNWVEIVSGTDPFDATDKPAAGTWENLNQNTDSDNDGVVDWLETLLDSDPNNGNSVPDPAQLINDPTGDADGDGVPNWVEIVKGNDPFDASDKPADGTWGNLNQNTDTDGDGVVDWIEIVLGTNPNDNTSEPDPTQLINDPNGDADGDGVPNWVEIVRGTDPFDPSSKPADGTWENLNQNTDTDKDGVADWLEILLGTNPNDPKSQPDPEQLINDPNGDADGDGVPNWVEIVVGTDPFDPTSKPDDGTWENLVQNKDSDGDGVPDWIEEALGTNPNNPNSRPENSQLINDPNGDADGDGVPNWVEIVKGTDPFNPSSKPADGTWETLNQNTDTDNDGVVDWLEVALGSDKNDPKSQPENIQLINDPNGDADGDGVPNWVEIIKGTDPFDASDTPAAGSWDNLSPTTDTDKDGVADWLEVLLGSNQNDTTSEPDDILIINDPNGDADGDGVPNWIEIIEGTDPLDPSSKPEDGWEDKYNQNGDTEEGKIDLSDDFDKDKVPDWLEVLLGSDPKDPASKPQIIQLINDPTGDADGDGVPNWVEIVEGSDPFDPTSEPDDGWQNENTNMNKDSDGDKVPDWLEKTLGTDPENPADRPTNDMLTSDPNGDADGDGVPNWAEIVSVSDPFDPTSVPKDDSWKDLDPTKDTDGDTIPDWIEIAVGTNPNDIKDKPIVITDGDGNTTYLDPDKDNDGDGVTNENEVNNGSDPLDDKKIPAGADDPKNVSAVAGDGTFTATWTGSANHGSYKVKAVLNTTGTVYLNDKAVSGVAAFEKFTLPSGIYTISVIPVSYKGDTGDAVSAGSDLSIFNSDSDMSEVISVLGTLNIGYNGGDSADSVTQNLTLPTANDKGVTVTWSSDKSNVASSGVVKRPSCDNGNSGDVEVKLTVTAKKNVSEKSNEFTLKIKYEPKAATISSDPDVTGNSDGSIGVAWAGSKKDGKYKVEVLCPGSGNSLCFEKDDASSPVTLTLTNGFESGDYNVKITAYNADKTTVSQTATKSVTIKNNHYDAIDVQDVMGNLAAMLVSSHIYVNNVTGNITLPTGTNGVSIVWNSKNDAIVSDSGAVTRPTWEQGDTNVTLTATFTKGNITQSADVEVKVIHEPADAATPENCSAIAGNGTITVSWTGLAKDGSYIVRVSNNNGIPELSREATVTTGNPGVTFSGLPSGFYTVRVGNVRHDGTTEIMNVIVNSNLQVITDVDAVDAFIATLESAIFAQGDHAGYVTRDMNLFTSKDGMTITWTSDKTDIIANTGAVTRPDYNGSVQFVIVKLTAVVAKNSAEVTKVISVNVIPTYTAYQNGCLDAVTMAMAHFAGDNSANKVTFAFTLDNVIPGKDDVTVDWESGDEILLITKNSLANDSTAAMARRPAFTEGNKAVSLKAKLTFDDGTVLDKEVGAVTILCDPALIDSENMSPKSGDIELTLDTIVRIPFKGALNPSTVNGTTVTLSKEGGLGEGNSYTVTLINDNKTIVITPESTDSMKYGLVSGSLYSVTLSGVKDVNGNTIDYAYSFTTINLLNVSNRFDFGGKSFVEGGPVTGISGLEVPTKIGSTSINNDVRYETRAGRKSISFDGDGDALKLTDVDLGEAYSIAVWVLLDPNESNNDPIQTLISNAGSHEYTDGFKLFINTDEGSWVGGKVVYDRRIVFEAGNGGYYPQHHKNQWGQWVGQYDGWGAKLKTVKNFVNYSTDDLNGDGLPDPKWYHFVITVDRTSKQVKLYFDGKFETMELAVNEKRYLDNSPIYTTDENGNNMGGKFTYPTNVPSDFNVTKSIYVGCFPDTQHDYKGNMTDIRVYDRVLTPEEIARIAQQK